MVISLYLILTHILPNLPVVKGISVLFYRFIVALLLILFVVPYAVADGTMMASSVISPSMATQSVAGDQQPLVTESELANTTVSDIPESSGEYYHTDVFAEEIPPILDKETIYGDDGSEIYTEYFRYTRTGRLRAVDRVYPDGKKERASLLTRDGCIASASVAEKNDDTAIASICEYDNSSRLTRRIWYKDGEQHREMQNTYDADSKRPVSVTIADKKNEISQLSQSIDENGRCTHSIQKDSDGRIVQEDSFDYDADGNLIQRKIIASTWQKPDELTFILQFEPVVTVSVYEYTYTDNGDKEWEQYTENGILQYEIRFADGKRIEESYYRGGELFLKVYFVNEQKEKEELYRNGTITHMRFFK